MNRTFFRYLLPFCSVLLTSSLTASPTTPISELTGIYYIVTGEKPYPLLSINLGQVRSMHGQLTDKGCSTRDSTTTGYTTDLNALFHDVDISESRTGKVLSKRWEQESWDGMNPFAGSAVTLNISDRAELNLVHTVKTYSDEQEKAGPELCLRQHTYQIRAVE